MVENEGGKGVEIELRDLGDKMKKPKRQRKKKVKQSSSSGRESST